MDVGGGHQGGVGGLLTPPEHSALMPLTLPLVPIRTAGHTVTQVICIIISTTGQACARQARRAFLILEYRVNTGKSFSYRITVAVVTDDIVTDCSKSMLADHTYARLTLVSDSSVLANAHSSHRNVLLCTVVFNVQ